MLRNEGVGHEDPVGVDMPRSPEMVQTILGISKSGGAYVPMSASSPDRRRRRQAENAGIRRVVVDGGGTVAYEDWPVEVLDLQTLEIDDQPGTPPGVDPGPQQLFGILHTSGSTGHPKGVAIVHRAVTNVIQWHQRIGPLEEGDTVLQKTPASFDVSAWEIFGPLSHGNTLVLPDPNTHERPGKMLDALRRHEVTHLHVVPSQLQLLLAEEAFHGDALALRHVVSAGEVLTPRLRDAFAERFPDATLHNGYGPTETYFTTHWHCGDEADAAALDGDVPIGTPLDNNRDHVVDESLELRPIGTVGELWVTGAGLARGYVARPRLTARQFVPDPFGDAPGGRAYRTGDRAFWTDDGALLFHGRRDRQVKIRGHRIELDEALESHPDVERAAAVADGPGDGTFERLLGYVEVDEDRRSSISRTDVRRHLERRLPPSMSPSRIEWVDQMPTTATGKIDRDELPAPGEGLRPREHVAPRTSTEKAIAAIWREHLEVDPIGVHEHFFEIGGDSLTAVRIQHDIAEELNGDLPFEHMLGRPTIAQWANVVDGRGPDERAPIEPHDYGSDAPLSAEQRRLWFLQQLDADNVAYQVPCAVRLAGNLDRVALREAFDDLVARHELLRTTFPRRADGPVQSIHDAVSVDWEFARTDGDTALRHVEAAISEPFDLTEEPPLRVRLWEVADDEYVLLALFHHVAIDEWTMGVMLEELGALYEARTNGEPAALEPLPIQYADYAIWQRERLATEAADTGLDFWCDTIEGLPES
ncbi:MAG: amino acid adenylation domain-containing protein, partial [Bradymonadaceae bacterium]